MTLEADGKPTLLVNLGGSWHEKLAFLIMNDFDVFPTLHVFLFRHKRA